MALTSQTGRPITLDDLGDRPIRLVTFDLYDTLIELRPRRWERLQAALRRIDLAVDADALKRGDIAAEDYFTIENGRWPIRDRSVDEQHAFRLEHLRTWLAAADIVLETERLETLLQVYRAEFDAHARGGAYHPFE